MNWLGSLIFLGFFAILASGQNIEIEKRLDAFAQKIQSDLQLNTGFSVGVVKDGELILQKQYGFLNVEKKTPLEADTPFYIASTTKSFVGLLAVILAEKGFFKLDAPISKYLPELVFADKKLQADKITIRDLLNHVHGISNEIVTFNTAYAGLNISDKNLLEDFQKESSFTNNNFGYSNVGYILTGLIIKKMTGKSWQENLKKYVLKPADLNATSPYVSDFPKNKLPFAHYSFRRENGFAQEPFIKIDQTMHAAGGMLSTVSDAAKWIILHLNQGKYKGVQVFPNKYFAETLKPKADLKTTFFNYERSQYGLGWYHAKLNKYSMIHSFGSFLGARSHISFLPEQNLGVCVFINESGRGIFVTDLIANYIYGLLLNDENVISATENELAKQTKTFQEAIAKKPPELSIVEISANELKKFAGIYSHQALGKLMVKILNGKIFIELGNISEFTVDFNFDEKDITKSSINVVIKTKSIDTGINARDEHLRTADFFEVEKFPDITFKSKQVIKKGKKLTLVGDFTMHGVTKEISFPFEIVGKSVDTKEQTVVYGFSAKTVINRRDFGVNYQHQTVPNFIGDNIEVDLSLLTRANKL